ENPQSLIVAELIHPQVTCTFIGNVYHTGMLRTEVEPMPSNLPDQVARSGLWKVIIYECERFVRT
ncbi:MAG TPA: hypothetical protein VLB68_12155, partial [Pyrinomonadaceae bacterium]|nr:hypothetical protein [Pyrinomonadaceae bacterium]